ncbi:carbon monoxide dehydrogenase accessory protein [Gordonia sp. HNM0687]|uniref:Carbon monoxide dehydrogenase accessory protein n=1 Tax=Gordonia mangrovi TaxID=2665643 RepID=A0A6L7GMA2_9ACTN|nr:XdhC family protein [Gordonia mangrovi]MXP20623.1 carbon monoxide dehydrogenase accessory protein [Gordonia mangrovi]UVF78796.1 XdhC family protein [Gordonia mangrovi]
MTSDDRRSLDEVAAEFTDRRTPFARATVVRAQPPTSARAGDQALVTPDGQMFGFVGGQCAIESVRQTAVDSIADGEGVLLRVLPDGADAYPETSGALVAVNPCLSGGALEIFIQPVVPTPIIHVIGDKPIALAVVDQARLLGFEVRRADPDEAGGHDVSEPDAVMASIVATHGGDEAGAIRAALESGVPFVGLVASRTRGAAILDAMDLSAPERKRVHTPVGIDIGARTPPEIALSVMAQVVAAIRQGGIAVTHGTAAGADADAAGADAEGPRREVDPICGMTVVVTDDTVQCTDESGPHWFCCTGCRDTFVARSAGGLQAAR